jgi:hypothetical protein
MTTNAAERASLFRLVCEHPALNVGAGFILMLTGVLESLEPVLGRTMPIGAHHGVAIFGLVQFMKFLPDMLKGMQFVEQGEKQARATTS